MTPGGRCTRRAFSAWLSALMVALSVAVPILERADLDHHVRWESEHDPGLCAPAHDHTICTQVGANLSMPARATGYSPTLSVLPGAHGKGLAFAFRRSAREGHPTRAPPSV